MSIEVTYIAIAEGADRIKIGKTFNVTRRLKQTTDCPFPIRLLCTIPSGIVSEARMHFAFRKFRLHQEWFAASKLILAFAARLAQGDDKAESAVAWLNRRILRIGGQDNAKCPAVTSKHPAATNVPLIVERIKMARRDQGISLRALGAKSGVAWNTIARIERGVFRDPKLQTLRLICAALKIAEPTLMMDTKSPHRPKRNQP